MTWFGHSPTPREANSLHYHYGSNIPGYLPMADEPYLSETWEGARDALVDEIERAGDMADVDDYAPGWGDSWTQALEDVRTWDAGKEIYVNICSDSPHDLGVSYWVTACMEDECWQMLGDDR